MNNLKIITFYLLLTFMPLRLVAQTCHKGGTLLFIFCITSNY